MEVVHHHEEEEEVEVEVQLLPRRRRADLSDPRDDDDGSESSDDTMIGGYKVFQTVVSDESTVYSDHQKEIDDHHEEITKIVHGVITNQNLEDFDIAEIVTGLAGENVTADEEVIELEYERAVVHKLHTHTPYCPNCNAEITKVILRRKKEEDERRDLFGCLTFFKVFIPSGNCLNPFVLFKSKPKVEIPKFEDEQPLISTHEDTTANAGGIMEVVHHHVEEEEVVETVEEKLLPRRRGPDFADPRDDGYDESSDDTVNSGSEVIQNVVSDENSVYFDDKKDHTELEHSEIDSHHEEISKIVHDVINRQHIVNFDAEIVTVPATESLIVEESDDEEVIELEFERAVDKIHTHTPYCPNCSNQITKVILRRKKKASPRPDKPLDLLGCLSCFSIFIPSGDCLNPFRLFKSKPKLESHEIEEGQPPISVGGTTADAGESKQSPNIGPSIAVGSTPTNAAGSGHRLNPFYYFGYNSTKLQSPKIEFEQPSNDIDGSTTTNAPGILGEAKPEHNNPRDVTVDIKDGPELVGGRPALQQPLIVEAVGGRPPLQKPLIFEAVGDRSPLQKPLISEAVGGRPPLQQPLLSEIVGGRPALHQPLISEEIGERPTLQGSLILHVVGGRPTLRQSLISVTIIKRTESVSRRWPLSYFQSSTTTTNTPVTRPDSFPCFGDSIQTHGEATPDKPPYTRGGNKDNGPGTKGKTPPLIVPLIFNGIFGGLFNSIGA